MNALHLRRLCGELDRWRAAGREPRFWIRDDDACGVTDQLQRLCTIAARYRVSIGLALVPGLLEDELVGFLAAHRPQLFPMCHGWKHANHGSRRNPGEFGETRPVAASCADAARALAVFRRHFAAAAVFVPPFGRIAAPVVVALRELGFVALSGAQRTVERRCARLIGSFGWAPSVPIARPGPLPRIDAHVDLIDWRAGTAADPALVAADLLAQLRLRRMGLLPATAPIGLLTHHRVHDERVWQLLERMIEFLRQRDLSLVDVCAMFGSAQQGAAASSAWRIEQSGGGRVRKLSIIIKCFNEEANIASAIASSLAAAAPFGGEVIVADGASTDRTVEIARSYPVTTVVLRHPEQRCCGIGPEMGFRHCSGEYVYILDGDMTLLAPFIAKALAYLDGHPEVAGVGGDVRETRAPNSEFRSRIKRLARLVVDKETDMTCLNGGGLYRRAALLAVGYMSDQNLHGGEEYDLGARLRSSGWRIVRLAGPAADHFAHELPTLPLLWRRVRNRRFLSIGEIVRAAGAAGYLPMLCREMRVLQLAVGVCIYWLAAAALVAASGSGVAAACLLLALPALAGAAISWRHRAFDLGVLSLINWHLAALGLLLGVLRRRVSPLQPIACVVAGPTAPAVRPPGALARPR